MSIRQQQKIRNDEVISRIGMARDIVQKIKDRKLNLSGHSCRMRDDRLLKQVVFGITDGSNGRERTRKRWTDDVEEWCNNDLHNLRKRATGRMKWQQRAKHAIDTNGH